MAVRPGEENVATLFGDVHYFYGSPSANPPHHRFDKGSYVYLFENANDRRARIEIANQPGTEDQDAFDGFLDRTRVRYSYKQQCVVNITVDGIPGSPPPPPDPSQWHLPTYDPRNENKYHYRLHSLDIYFWTQDDALQFVNGIRRVLPAQQVEVADEPAPPPSQTRGHVYSDSQDINPLVQRLESAAISGSVAQQQQQQQQQAGIPNFASPPPPPPPMNGSSSQQQGSSSPHNSNNFVPMAYNPAAPPERERYQHREKTPPPEDDGHDPLAAALARDQQQQHVGPGPGPFSPGYGQTTFASGPMTPGLPPSAAVGGLTSPGFPPTQQQQQYARLQQPQQPQRAATMPMLPLASPGLASPYGGTFPGSPSFAPPPTTGSSPQQPHSGLSYQPTSTTTAQAHTNPQTQSLHHATPPPPGGYAQYNYNAPPPPPLSQQQPGAVGGTVGADYGIHQQVYRPTSQEYNIGGNSSSSSSKYKTKPENEKPSKLGQNAERLERGVTGMLKKFEKKFG